jgi:hypothetical protein
MQLSHNSSLSNCVIMEEDCEDASPNLPPKMEMMDLTHLFGAFTQQMTSHIDKLHDQLRLNDERTVQSQLAFQQEIRSELDALRTLVHQSSSASLASGVSASPALSPLQLPLLLVSLQVSLHRRIFPVHLLPLV